MTPDEEIAVVLTALLRGRPRWPSTDILRGAEGIEVKVANDVPYEQAVGEARGQMTGKIADVVRRAFEADVCLIAGRLHAILVSIDPDNIEIKPSKLIEMVRRRLS